MASTFLSNPLFTEIILPFLLVFTLIFAILDKTKILGEGKKQINAIISFVIALILVSYAKATGIIVGLMPVLAVIAVVILVFMILYGFAAGDKEFSMPKGLKITFGILVAIALIIALLVLTGYWNSVVNIVLGKQGGTLSSDIIFIVVIIAAIALVLWPKKPGS